jgi:hypothetical protein
MYWLLAMITSLVIMYFHWKYVIVALYRNINKSYSTGVLNSGLYYYEIFLFIVIPNISFFLGARLYKQIKTRSQIKEAVLSSEITIPEAFKEGVGYNYVKKKINSLFGKDQPAPNINRKAKIIYVDQFRWLVLGSLVCLGLLVALFQFYAIRDFYYRSNNHLWGVYLWDFSLVLLAGVLTAGLGFRGYRSKILGIPSGTFLK